MDECRIKLNSAHIYHCDPDWAWSPKDMPDYDLWLVFEGSGSMLLQGASIPLSRGDCFVMPPGFSCSATHDPENPISAAAAHFFPLETPWKIPLHRRLQNTEFLAGLMERAAFSWSLNRKKDAELWIKAALMEVGNVDSMSAEPPAGAEGRLAAIDGLCAEIASHPELEWGVESMAARMDVCRDHFGRLFRKRRGKSPVDFVIDARVEKAKALLASSAHSVERVAEMSGYESLSFFSRQFKARTGTSPNRYRASLQGQSKKAIGL